MRFECPGCAQRREAIRQAGRRMADWVRGGTPPIDPVQRVALPDHIVELRALARFLAENAGATENDWHTATDELRDNYRRAVKSEV